MDNVLSQLFSKVDYVDLYALADPNKCRDYVIVGGKSLEDIFFKMNLYPAKAKDGSLYFQKISRLQGKLPSEAHAAQQQNCKELAFFFVRIFQIFGALYLSLYDSDFPKADPEDERSLGIRSRKDGPLLATDVFGKVAAKSAQAQAQAQASSSWFGFGGELKGQYVLKGKDEGENRYLKILNKYLVPVSSTSSTYRLGDKVHVTIIEFQNSQDYYEIKLEYRFRHDVDYRMTATGKIIEKKENSNYEILINNFDWEGRQPELRSELTDASKTFSMNPDGSTSPHFSTLVNEMFSKILRDTVRPYDMATAKYLRDWGYLPRNYSDTQLIRTSHVYMKANQEHDKSAKIIWRTNVKIRGSDRDRERTVNADIAAMLTIESKGSRSYMVTINFFDTYISPREAREEIDLPSQPVSMSFTTLGDRITDRDLPKSQTNGYTIPEFIEETFKELVRDVSTDRRTTDRQVYNKEVDMFRPYNSAAIPTGFKVQGLWKAMVQNPPIKAHCVARASQLLSSKALYGNFADAAFSSVCRLKFAYQKDGSLPEPGRPIVTSKGVAALANLFIDTLHNGSPKLTADKPKWDAFRQQMRQLFEFSTDSVEGITFPDIKQETPAICELNPVSDKDVKIQLRERTARKLYAVTQNLMSQQREHAGAAMTLIFELFDQNELQKNKKVVLNKQLYTEGMPRVQEIANSAITLLTKYYKDCETTYQEGVRMVYNAELKRDPLPVPTVTAGSKPLLP